MLAQSCSSSRFARKSRFSLPKSEIVPPACSCVSLHLNVPSKSFPLTAPFTPIVYFPDATISATFLFSTTVGRSFMVFLATSRILLLLLKNAPLQIPMIKIIATTATAPIVHMIFFGTFLPDFPFVLVISPIVTSSFSLICFHLSNFP